MQNGERNPAHQGLVSFFQLHQAEDEVLIYPMHIRFSPVGYKMRN